MTKIITRAIREEIISQLRLNAVLDKIPEDLADRIIIPVFNVNEKGTHKILIDTSLNNSDKTFIVPQNELWEIMSISGTLTTTATVGSRRLQLEILNLNSPQNEVIWRCLNDVSLSANFSTNYLCQGDQENGGIISLQVVLPAPKYVMPNNMIHVFDSVGVDPTDDDLTVHIVYKKYVYNKG